jgi:thiol-disulfide isomerase/thioredoxin
MLKYFSIISSLALLFCYCPLFSQVNPRPTAPTIKEDSLWLEIDSSMTRFEALSMKKNVLNLYESDVLIESYRNSIRIKGLEFWKDYPNDNRRYEWFLWTVNQAPIYFNVSNAQLDSDHKNQWAILYPSLQKDYLNSLGGLTAESAFRKKAWLKTIELRATVVEAKFLFKFKGDKLNLDKFSNDFFELAKICQNTDFFQPLIRIADKLVADNFAWGISREDIHAFLQKAVNAGVPQLAEWAIGKNKLLAFKQQAIDLSFTTVDGKILKLSQMRGKVILIDFWATWCGSCLDYMPVIKDLFTKYHNKGFEVWSVSINRKAEKDQVLAVKKRMDTTWPLAIIGEERIRKDIWQQFKFNGIPQLLLIDKLGRLIENNGVLMNPKTLDDVVKHSLD